MVYLDPPFFTQKVHSLKNNDGKEYSFNDTWDSIDDYLTYLKVRLVEIKRLLNDTGSVFLHCDSSASPYLRILLDEIFGPSNFRSEIIWTYKRWSNSHNGLLNAHQTIFFYSKSAKYTFNKLYSSYSPTTNIDQILQDRVRNKNGKAVYKTDSDGNTVFTNEKKGVPLSDVWDIPFLNPKAKERVGYPTQKPILLLERIIEIATDPKDIILDPFCGSGTTLVAASLLDRKYIGIDINPEAVRLSQERLLNPVKTDSKLMKLGKSTYDAKSTFEKLILSNFECNIVQRNKGLDAILVKMYKGAPVPIRIQKQNEDLSTAVNLLHHAALKKKCKLMILIRTNDDVGLLPVEVPPEMMIMDSYQFILEKRINRENK